MVPTHHPRLFVLLALAVVLIPVLAPGLLRPARAAEVRTWLCFYGAELSADKYQRFDLVVFDALRHPPLERTRPGAPLLLGSIAAGRGAAPTLSFEEAHDRAFEGRGGAAAAQTLDIRSAKWRARLLDVLIPQALSQGFDGVLLEGLDAALGGGAGPDAELRAAIPAFLAQVRQRYPRVPVAMNRGLELLPEAAPFVDFLLVEELSAEYDFAARQYRDVQPAVRQVLVAALRRAQAANPKLTVLSLDYAAPDQGERIAAAIAYARGKGFVPYVATPALDQAFAHSLAR